MIEFEFGIEHDDIVGQMNIYDEIEQEASAAGVADDEAPDGWAPPLTSTQAPPAGSRPCAPDAEHRGGSWREDDGVTMLRGRRPLSVAEIVKRRLNQRNKGSHERPTTDERRHQR